MEIDGTCRSARVHPHVTHADDWILTMTDTVVSTKDPSATARPSRVTLWDGKTSAGPTTFQNAERDRLEGLQWQHFEAKQLGCTVGAELSGVDLTVDLPDAVITEIRQALYDYKVIFFRDQPLTSERHVAFARRFGELEVHPFIPSNTGEPHLVRFQKTAEVAGFENTWHHDVTWRLAPSMGAILHAIKVPKRGGDTLFADMYSAYEGLPPSVRERLENLNAIHDYERSFGRVIPADVKAAMREKYPVAKHPVVCTHDGTGRKHLYVNRIFTIGIEGFDDEEFRELLELLARQSEYPEHQCRFEWSDHSVAFWDNRAVQHYAASDYYPHLRTMERASIKGTAPHR